MLAELFAKHQPLISSWSVTSLDREGVDLRFKIRVDFIDGSLLYIRQVVIGGELLTYAYQWQSAQGVLITRWDNATHWPDIATFPHHKHVLVDGAVHVLPSKGADLALVMEEIASKLQPSDDPDDVSF